MEKKKKKNIIREPDLPDGYLDNLDIDTSLLKRNLGFGYYSRKIKKYDNYLKKIGNKYGTNEYKKLFELIPKKERESLEDKLFELLDLEPKIPKLLKLIWNKTAENYITIINGPRPSITNNPFYDFYNKNKK
jgi:hypothetical protein